MPTPKPITRIEQYLHAMSGDGRAPDKPITRVEQYLAVLKELITLSGEITAQDFDDALRMMKQIMETRVTSLNETQLAKNVIHATGDLIYVKENVYNLYSDFNLARTGWYVFARIAAKNGVDVTNATVEGAEGYYTDSTAVYVAVRFETASVSASVSVTWGGETEKFVFEATDQAITNLDYRVTFYIYDVSEFATWTYTLTTDPTFVDGSYYYTKDENDIYTLAEVTAGESVPEDTYYKHAGVTFEGMTRNITYICNTPIDCPVTFILPEIESDTHGAWIEIRFLHTGSFSSTLVTPEGVKVATEHTQPETKGFNTVDLHYNSIAGKKAWRFLNTHSTIPD